jgi:hypothetical protein
MSRQSQIIATDLLFAAIEARDAVEVKACIAAGADLNLKYFKSLFTNTAIPDKLPSSLFLEPKSCASQSQNPLIAT